MGRWLLLPEHRARAIARFQAKALEAGLRSTDAPDVIHAHDFPALEPASRLAAHYSSRLVYDSHEYWRGLPRHGRPEPIRRRSNQARERDLAREADAVIMVSDMGAALLADRLGLDRVEVVRNTFPTRTDLVPPDHPNGAVYAGRIAPGRDLATVLAASSWHKRPGFALHFMGDVDGVSVPDFVTSHPMGTMEQVDRLLADVGVGLVTMSDGPINHRIALPNKLFQAISAGIPVVASDLPQTAAVVEEHGLGALYKPGDPGSFDQAVGRLIDDYSQHLTMVRNAQPLFDWSVDATRLIETYRSLATRPSRLAHP
jgi:glycosyltransferase involved in cell wall biosynthesis